jgi:hypothetical protein
MSEPFVPQDKLKLRPPSGDLPNCGQALRLSPAFEKRQESAQRVAQIEQHLAAQELRRAVT